MSNLTHRFGKHVYDFYSRHTNKQAAEKDLAIARKSFSGARIAKSGDVHYPWYVFADVKSLKNPEQPAYHKGGVVHTRKVR